MYFPKSQITTNLYTNGEEYQTLLTRKEYIGFYWKTSSGKFFSGKTPQDIPIEELTLLKISSTSTPALDELSNTYLTIEPSRYTKLKKINTNSEVLLPSFFPNIPTEKDYQIGEYQRYFCKKTNELLYLEISKETFDNISTQNPIIAFQYYQPFNIPWVITGEKKQVYKINKNIVELTIKQQKLFMFDKYLQEDYTKYYK